MSLTFKNEGFCPICRQNVSFKAYNKWFRDYYICSNCASIPRERALMYVLEMYYPNWNDLTIHESSPVFRGASQRIAAQCKKYIPTYYFPDTPGGSFKNGYRCENLENLTFENESIDIHISQDVMEHVFDPGSVFREIKRTLRSGGAHIFTVPLVNKTKPTQSRALLNSDGTIEYLLKPNYHGNPIATKGALVTFDWGFDICEHIFKESGLFTEMIYIDDISRGIRAEFIEVLVTRKIVA